MKIIEFLKNIFVKKEIVRTTSNQYIRKEIYPIKKILNNRNFKFHKNDYVNFDGDMIHMNSDRYHTFAEKGVVCAKCGLKARYFAKEKSIKQKNCGYHFNLYGINKNYEEILFTKDHIIPKSKGGDNKISNYQTMCYNCNYKKGNN